MDANPAILSDVSSQSPRSRLPVVLAAAWLLTPFAGAASSGPPMLRQQAAQPQAQATIPPVTSTTGKWAITPQFVQAGEFRDGLAPVQIWDREMYFGKWGYIDKQGTMVIAPQFDRADVFSDGLAAILVGKLTTGKWGYIDKQGTMVIQPQFGAAQAFSDGLARVRIGRDTMTEKYGYIDTHGTMVVTPQFRVAGSFGDGLAPVHIGDAKRGHGKFGYIDTHGTLVITPQFDNAETFSEGLAAVRESGSQKFGYIDRRGTMVIRPQFHRASPFKEGLAPVSTGENVVLQLFNGMRDGGTSGKFGYIDRQGKMVIRRQFQGAHGFSDGLAAVSMTTAMMRVEGVGGPLTGYINERGERVIQPQFGQGGAFSEGLAPACLGGVVTLRPGEQLQGRCGFISR